MPAIVARESTPAMQTPCTKICTLDAKARLCIGCLRTLDEIARWASMSEEERARIMAELPARRIAEAPASTR